MQTFTPPPVAGYRGLTDVQVQAMNANKQLEERCLRQLEIMLMDPGVDTLLVSIARTRIQEAFMWANRAIAQPQRIALPEDGPPPGSLIDPKTGRAL